MPEHPNLRPKEYKLQLLHACLAHGVVTEANLMTDRATGRPRGFAFVTMASAEEAQKAIEAMNGANLDGRNLTVNEARPREERSGGASAADATRVGATNILQSLLR